MKLAVLLLIVTSQKGQTVLSLSLDGLDLSNPVVFKLKTLLKHNRSGDSLSTIILKLFDECKKLCVVRTLKEYVNQTKKLKGEEKKLLVSFAAPHARISRDTLSRWTLFVLNKAGVDTKKYASHSTRGASGRTLLNNAM